MSTLASPAPAPAQEIEAEKLGERIADAPAEPGTQPTPAASVPAPAAPASASWTYHDWWLFVTASVELRADDNLLQSDDTREGDLIGVLQPSLAVDYSPAIDESQAVLHLDYSPAFLGYLDHSEFNAIDQAGHLRFQRHFNRSAVSLEHTAALDSSPSIEQAQRGLRHTETTDASYGYDLSGRTSLTLAPRQQWSNVEGGITSWEYGLGLDTRHQRTGRIALLAGYRINRFTADPDTAGFSHSLSGGVAWEVTELNRLTLQGGAQAILLDTDDAEDGVSPGASLAWNYQFLPKTSLTLALDHSRRVSEYVAGQLNEATTGRLRLYSRLLERLDVECRLGAGWVAQQSTSTTGLDGGDYTYWSAAIGANYHIGRQTDLRADYEHSERTANQLYDQFARNLVRLAWLYRF